MKTISIVLPIYNEEENLSELLRRLGNVSSTFSKYAFEFIFVDDGSTDSSASRIKEWGERDERVKLLLFSRNFGHQIALTAGIDHAAGDCAIVMDTDLQHPPELIAEMLKKWEEGYEIVNTVRQNTADASFFKKASALMFYWVINKMTRLRLEFNSADFRLMDRKVVEALTSMREQYRFLRGLVSWIGYRQTSLSYVASSRFVGKSKYSLKKMVMLGIDGITAFSTIPLHIATMLGLIVSLLSFIYAFFAIYIKVFTGGAIQGWASVLVTILFLGGCQLISIGVIGEYISRIYGEVKKRPLYIIKEKVGIEKDIGH